jgi:hypothetical protein
MRVTTARASAITALAMVIIATVAVVGMLPKAAGAAKSQNCNLVKAGSQT